MRVFRVNGGMLGAVALVLAALGSLQVLQGVVERSQPGVEGPELLYVPDHRILHVIALGDDATAADLLWVRSVFYIAAANFEDKQAEALGLEPHEHGGGHHEHKRMVMEDGAAVTGKGVGDKPNVPTEGSSGFDSLAFNQVDFSRHPVIRRMLFWNLNSGDVKYLQRILETVSELDPWFETPYVQGALNLTMMAGRYREGLAILERGEKHIPDSWQVYYYQGFIKLFYMNDKEGAAQDIMTAAGKPGALPIVVHLAANLQVGLGHRGFALEFLRSLYEVSEDENIRRMAERLLMAYQAKGKG